MLACCLLDRLPVELLHNLFDYFVAPDIFLTFSDVSDYINSVVRSYPHRRLHLRSIRRSHFNFICHHVQPEQVISLLLSDADDTPGLSQLFLSHFRLEQFIRLRSLTLIDIEFDSLELIFSHLYKLDQLRAFSFNDQSIRYQYTRQVRHVPFQFTDTATKTLSQLNRLYLSSDIGFTSILFPHLRYLELEQRLGGELERIFQHAPQLQSLRVCLNSHGSNFDFTVPQNQLAELRLEIQGDRISMSEIERFLLQLPRLKHLELRARAVSEIANGNRWQVVTSSLITFHFKFDVLLLKPDRFLHSFGTPFWVEEKHWFVAYQNASLFSIPHFAPVRVDSMTFSGFSSTASDLSIVFNHIKTLELQHSTLLPTFQSAIDLVSVEHLIIPSLIDLLIFLPLKDQIPQLNELTVKGQITKNMIEQFKCYQFEKIVKLELSMADYTDRDYIFEDLFSLFPSVQYLQDHTHIRFEGTMIHLINGFKSLVNASFYFDPSLSSGETLSSSDTNSIIQLPGRLTKNNFTRRLYRLSNEKVVYNWWIDPKASDCRPRECTTPKRSCFWYISENILRGFLH